jgi:hypothetical protein
MTKRSKRGPGAAAKTQVTSEAATDTEQSGATLGFEASCGWPPTYPRCAPGSCARPHFAAR